MSNIQLVLVVLFAGTVAAQVNPYADCCDSYCYKDDENPYLYLGTKTAYEFIYGKSSIHHIVPYCRPILFWSFNRYGSRYPDPETIRSLQTLQKLKENLIKNYDTRGSYPDTGKLCDKDLEGFRRWNWNISISESMSHELTPQGRDDMKYLARRYQTRYPEMLRVPYSNLHFDFRYSDIDHTRSSYEAFAEGLFGPDAYKSQAQPMTYERNYDNRNYDDRNYDRNRGGVSDYKQCNAWIHNVKDNPNTFFEFERFKERDEYKRVIAHVSRRLGFRYTLNETLVQTMYEMCRYEKSWYVNKVSPWCAAFTKEHLKVMEYAEDLKSYYMSGYGHELNQKVQCSTVKDMMQRLERLIEGYRNESRVIVQFTQSEPLQLLLVALGINKDSQPLTADSMRIQQRRLWRTSYMDPFSANLVAVLYQCNEGEKHRVMFFLNEKPVDYPGCAVGLCNWNYLKEQLQETVNACDGDFCEYGSATTSYVSYSLLLLTTLLPYFLKK